MTKLCDTLRREPTEGIMSTDAAVEYDPSCDAVWIGPNAPDSFRVCRVAVENLVEADRELAGAELETVCAKHKDHLVASASAKKARGEIESDGRVLLRLADIPLLRPERQPDRGD